MAEVVMVATTRGPSTPDWSQKPRRHQLGDRFQGNMAALLQKGRDT